LFFPSSISHTEEKNMPERVQGAERPRPAVVLVTGGSRGIGRAICIALAKQQRASVVFTYQHCEGEAMEVLRLIEAESPTCVHKAIRCDVSDESQCTSLMENVAEYYGGRLDALVNNAGICEDHDLGSDSETFEHWMGSMERIMRVNFFGAASLTFKAVKLFRSAIPPPPGMSPTGRIINVTSRAVYRGELTAPGYAASKAALSIFGQSLARRLGADRIAVYAVAPGWVETEMAKEALHGPNAAEVLAQHPLGRVAQPEEIAQQIVFLALDAPLAMSGATVDMNGASYLR
jgi:3-oxoacyl-[acyl-carrier protein] reductase